MQDPLWQSLLAPQRPEPEHLTPQLPPHWLLMSLGVQHFLLTHAKPSQSSPVVQPCVSLQRFEQLPLQLGPQQRSPEQAPLWQSVLAPQTLESGHLTPQLLPHLLLKSLGVQHFLSTHASNFPQSLSLLHSCPTAAQGKASSRRPTAATTAMKGMPHLGLINTASRAPLRVSIHIFGTPYRTLRELCSIPRVADPW